MGLQGREERREEKGGKRCVEVMFRVLRISCRIERRI